MRTWLKPYLPELHPELDRAIHTGVIRILKVWMIAIPALAIVTLIFNFFDTSLQALQIRLLLLIAAAFVYNILNLWLLQRSEPGSWQSRALQLSGLVYPMLTPMILVAIISQVRPDELHSWVGASIPQLQLLMIAASLFGFTFWVSLTAGSLSAAVYLGIVFYVPPQYRPDMPHIIESAVYLVVAGFIAGAGALEARNLVGRVVQSVKDQDFISRLLGTYVSEEVKERLLGGGLNLEGEEKDVAVLFSDLRDFTSLSEEMSPRTVVQILNLYFARMVAVISEEGGVVDKFIGDAIMAYFGAPVELSNARESATRAAHRMRAELTELNKTFASEFGIQLESGIGLHFGPVVIGNIGSPTRKDFTIIGDTVNIAARLEGLTRSMQSPIILSEEVRKGLTSEHRLIPLEELSLKGRKEPVVCFGVVEDALSG